MVHGLGEAGMQRFQELCRRAEIGISDAEIENIPPRFPELLLQPVYLDKKVWRETVEPLRSHWQGNPDLCTYAIYL